MTFSGSLQAAGGTFGTITSGYLSNVGNTAAIRLGGTTPLPADNFIDLTATGGAPFLKHGNLVLAANAAPIAKTVRFGHTRFQWNPAADLVMGRAFIEITSTNAATAWASFTLPKGVTITTLRLRARNGEFLKVNVEAKLYRVGDSGGSTEIASATGFTHTAWSTQSDTLSELVGDATYVLEVLFQITGSGLGDYTRQLAWVELDYTMPDYAKSL